MKFSSVGRYISFKVKTMRTILFTFMLLSVNCTAQESVQLMKSFKIGAYVTNGFYDIKKITFADYEAQGTQLSYGINVTYFPVKRFGINVNSGYTREEFHFANYVEGGDYWEPPTMTKSMAYMDIGGALQYDLLLKKKFHIGAAAGLNIGHLVEGHDVLTGIYGPEYPYYFTGREKQFNSRVVSSSISAVFSYSPINHFAIEIVPMWRHYFSEVVTNQEFDNSINLLIGISYRLNYPN